MKPTLLLIDDDLSVLNALDKLLKRQGYEMLLARTGAKAIELFSTKSVNLTILDVNLGEQTGWFVLEKLHEINAAVPTVIITAEFDQCATAIAAGAKGFIEKPIDVPRLLAVIRNVLAAGEGAHSDNEVRQDGRRQESSEVHQDLTCSFSERWSAPLTLSEQLRSVLESGNSAGSSHSPRLWGSTAPAAEKTVSEHGSKSRTGLFWRISGAIRRSRECLPGKGRTP